MEIFNFELLLLIAFVFHQLWRYFCGRFALFRCQGVLGPHPVPVFGTWWRAWEGPSPHDLSLQHHAKFGSIYATFRGPNPVLHVHDLKLMRGICVRDAAEHFGRRYRRPIAGENDYVNKALPLLHGEQWRTVRRIVATSFSSELAKERFDLADEALLVWIRRWRRDGGAGKMDLRVETELLCEEMMGRYAAGVQLGTIGSPDHPFALNVREAMEDGAVGQGNAWSTLTRIYPKLLQWVSRFMPTVTPNSYFVDLSQRLLKERAEGALGQVGGMVPDLIDRLQAAQCSPDGHVDDTVAVAIISSVLQAGYDLATALVRVLHCLALNLDAQERCREEILRTTNGGVSPDTATNLPYLWQCIREALRLYPLSSAMNRLCTKDYEAHTNFSKGKESPPPLLIPKGTGIEIPIFSTHRNPTLYPNPDHYNPERFASEQMRDRDPLHWLAFGAGRRGCPVQQFAMTFLAHCLMRLLVEFELFPVAETTDPLQLETGMSGLLTAREAWVGCRALHIGTGGALV